MVCSRAPTSGGVVQAGGVSGRANETEGAGMSTACIDCGIDTTDEYYMVKDDVWPIGKHDGMLCIGCLERRINRQLTPTDFTDASINWEGPKSDRLRNRLGKRRNPRGSSRG
jgi:hypothetical protein